MENDNFYISDAWRRLRYSFIRDKKRACQACGVSPASTNNVVLHVDHVIPRSIDKSKELDYRNLQILCADCNIGKSNIYLDDWRPDVPKLTRSVAQKQNKPRKRRWDAAKAKAKTQILNSIKKRR